MELWKGGFKRQSMGRGGDVMNIQQAPIDEPLIGKDGKVSHNWAAFFSSLGQQLQFHLSDDGYVLPQSTTAQVAKVEPKIQNAILYNTTTNRAMVKIGNTFKNIVTE